MSCRGFASTSGAVHPQHKKKEKRKKITKARARCRASLERTDLISLPGGLNYCCVLAAALSPALSLQLPPSPQLTQRPLELTRTVERRLQRGTLYTMLAQISTHCPCQLMCNVSPNTAYGRPPSSVSYCISICGCVCVSNTHIRTHTGRNIHHPIVVNNVSDTWWVIQ